MTPTDDPIFRGCIPALMTPCNPDRTPDYDNLVETGKKLMDAGMRAMVYCGSMGDWPLLTDEQRQEGVRRLVEAGVPIVVGTGAQNTAQAVSHAAHAKEVGAHGLMVIPRVLSRGTSPSAWAELISRPFWMRGTLCPPSFTTARIMGSRPRPICSSTAWEPCESDRVQGIRRFRFLKLCGRAHYERGSRSDLDGRSRHPSPARFSPLRGRRSDYRRRQCPARSGFGAWSNCANGRPRAIRKRPVWQPSSMMR